MRRSLAIALPWMLALLTLAAGGESCPAADGQAPKLDAGQPYQAHKSNPVTYDVDFSVVVTAPYHTKVLKVWLPLPQTDAGQEVEEKDLSAFPMKVEPRIAREQLFGNKFAFFEFTNPEGAQVIRHRFKIKVWELRWDVDPGKVLTVSHWPAAFDRYLRSEQTVVVDDRLRKLTQGVVPQRQGAARDMASAMAWVNDHLKYDHAQGSLRASSEHALDAQAGHCSDYHGLCAALGRALGDPTRVTYGINPLPKNSPSHCKLEAYLPPYGWVSFDVSETQLLLKAIKTDVDLDGAKKDALVKAATERFLRGFRDNTWYLQTRGTDYDLAPPAGKRVPLVRTIYAEADGVALPDPDPANPHQREFAWMTVHQYTPDKHVLYPFKHWQDLLDKR